VPQPKKPKSIAAPASANGHAVAANGVVGVDETLKRPIKISTVSHTLDADIAERLRYFAFRERISESAVIEFALRALLNSGAEPELGDRLRAAGAALRRKS